MEQITKIGRALHKVYVGIGVAAMGIIAFSVIFTVFARYFFSLSWKNLDELITTLFAFTTFWGLGIAVLESEHVVIDIVYKAFKPTVQRWMNIISLVMPLAVDLVVCAYSFQYVARVGDQLSPGMGIPMKYMYGIMPVCFILCAVCIVLKIISLVAGQTASGPDLKDEAEKQAA